MTDDLTHHIFQRIVVRLLHSQKFKSASESSINVLADYAIATITKFASNASNLAAHAGRTEVNVYDILISLSQSDYSFATLVTMFNSCVQDKYATPFDYMIRPYPIPKAIPFYESQQNSPDPTTFPFRANTTISYFEKRENPEPHYIPTFFPKPPPDFTIKETYPSDELSLEEAKILEDARDNAQRESRASLASLSKGTAINDKSDQITFELNLDPAPQISKPIAKWIPGLESPYYSLKGARPDNDPEFPPPHNYSEDKDLKNYPQLLSILQTVHKNDKNDSKNDRDDD